MRDGVFARRAVEVAAALKPPDWEIFAEEDPARPRWPDEDRLLESDIDHKADWLLEQIEIQRQQALGKRAFLFRAKVSDREKYRHVWARTLEEITTRYPSLTSMIGVGVSVEHLREVGYSDVDEPDEFLRRHEQGD